MTPYFLQPYKTKGFLTWKKSIWPSNITREYFLSFEDALWNLLPRLGYKKGSKILVPSFYCVDVITNMRQHGYEVVEYPTNPDLSISTSKVVEVIKKEDPDVFIDFEAVGIPTGLTTRIIRKLSFRTLIVHDKVHSVVGLHIEHFPLTERELFITSTRKVTPFPGSMVIYTRSARRSTSKQSFPYIIKAITLWVRYICTLKLAVLLNSVSIAKKAELLLKVHDDLIGDELESAPLTKKWFELIDRVNVPLIEETKQWQFKLYNDQLSNVLGSSAEAMYIDCSEYSEKLRGYPIILTNETASRFMSECRRNGFLTVSQLDNSTWAEKQKLFLLPLGPHLNAKDIQNIADIAKEALTRAIQYDNISA